MRGAAIALADLRAVHRDPVDGAPWWRGRAGAPTPGPSDLRSRPWTDFVPRSVAASERLVLVETGGTAGRPVCTAFTPAGFRANFVEPFLAALGPDRQAFEAPWLFVGPSGPHAIGRGAEECSLALTGRSASMVDMDPRWLRRIRPGFHRDRYLDHVVEQALDVLEGRAIGVLFSTPPLLRRIGCGIPPRLREAVTGIHWGGVAATAPEIGQLRDLFPRAHVRAGFGNSLVGLFPEVGSEDGLPIYGHCGGSHGFEVIDACGSPVREGATGQLRVSRLDACLWLEGLIERDRARFVRLPGGGPGFMPVAPETPLPGAEVIY